MSRFDVYSFVRRVSFGVALASFSAFLPAIAAPIQYQVTVDTSTISGVMGNLDFEFNPGNSTSQNAFATISAFGSVGGTLTGAPSTIGDVSGVLPGTVTFDNLQTLNDYFQGFTFGTSFHFLLTLDGAAIESPNHTATSGTEFGVGLYDSTGTTPLLTTEPQGFAGTVTIDRNGVVTPANFPPSAGGGTPVVTFSAPVTVPEPSTLMLLGSSFVLAIGGRKLKLRLTADRG